MSIVRKSAIILGLLGWLLLTGCASQRRTSQRVPPAVPAPQGQTPAAGEASPEDAPKTEASVPQPAPEGPPPSPDSPEEQIERLIDQANAWFSRGERLLQEGRDDEARQLFRRSLDSLKNSRFDFPDYPELEQAYYELLGEAQILEAQSSLEPSQLPFPQIVPSPLDEIAELNLYQVEVDPALEEIVSQDLRETRFDVPVVINHQVLKVLDYYQGRGRAVMEKGLQRIGKYLNLFRDAFAEEEIPQDLVYMAHVESLFEPRAYSRARAKGIWQFVTGTARLYGLKVDWWIDERSDIVKSTRAAARHLKDLHATFGDWHLALAAYNAGAGKISRVLRRHGQIDYWTMARRRLLPRETRNYVPSILASIIIFKHPGRYGFQVEPLPEIEWETVSLDFQIDLRVVADKLDVPLSEIAELNPELRRGVTPYRPDGFLLKVPLGSAAFLQPQLAELPPEQRLKLRHHRVRQGETLSQIALRYGISVRAIAEVNRIRNVHRLRLGQHLIIPLSDWKAVTRASTGSTETDRSGSRPAVYTVRRGDSLYKIALRYGLTVDKLASWNNLRLRQTIYPGQKIRLSNPAQSARRTAASSQN